MKCSECTLAKNASETELAFLDFVELPFYIALPLAGPSGIPADRLKILSDGFGLPPEK